MVDNPAFSDGSMWGEDILALWDAVSEMDDDAIENLEIDPALIKETERRALRLEIEREVRNRAKRDLLTYARLRYGYKCPHPHKVLYPYQEQIYRDYMEHDSVWLAAPRGFAKTSSTSDAVEWQLGNRPHLKWKIVSSTERTAIARLRQIQINIMFDPLFRSTFPNVRVDQTRFNRTTLNLVIPGVHSNQRDPTAEVFGYSASPEGARADALYFDDVCTFKNSIAEPKDRETIKERISTTWIPLRSRPELIMYWTCTLWHTEDASHELLRAPSGMHKRLVRISDDFTKMQEIQPTAGKTYPLPAKRWDRAAQQWESWWTEEALKNEYKRNPGAFGVAYWLRPVSQSRTSIGFPSHVFWGDEGKEKLGSVRYGLGPKHSAYRSDYVAMGVDLGFSGHREAAYTAITVGGVLEDRTRVLLDADFGRGWDINEKLVHMASLADKWRPDRIVVESNVGQKTVAEIMRDRREFQDAQIEAYQTGIAKDVKLRDLSEEMAEGKWLIPLLDNTEVFPASSSKHPIMELIRQMIAYPGSEFSDFVIAMMLLREGLREVTMTDDVWSDSVNLLAGLDDPVTLAPQLSKVPNFLK